MFSDYANAYVGPGVAGGVIAATIGIVASLFIAIFGIIYFPIKRAITRRKKNKDNLTSEIESD